MLQNNQKVLNKWPSKKLSELVELAYGQNLPKEKRVHGSTDVFGSNGIVDSHNEYLVKGPGIIVGRKGTIGKIIFTENNFWAIDTTYFIKQLEPSDFKWLYYCLQTLDLEKLNSATGVPGLNRNEAYSKKVFFPPLKIQQKIALILSTVDEEIQKTDQIIEKTEKLKEGLVSRIFFGEKYKTIKIRDVFKTSSGGTPLVKNKEYYENGTIPWLNSGEVSQGYIYSSNKKITELGLKKSSAKIFPIDTVLVAMYGVTAGKVGILKIESSTNQAICGIYPNNDYLPEFLYQYLKTQTDFLLKQGIGAAQPNISQETIKNINIPCFSILEQKKITKILASLDFKISEDKKSKSKLTSLKNGLMNDIFSQKVEVN